MGMSTHVTGLREPDGTHRKMVEAARACHDAGLEPPDKLSEYFGDLDLKWVCEDPSRGLEVDIPSKPYKAEMEEGIEIDLKDMPPNVRKVRFVNSY